MEYFAKTAEKSQPREGKRPFAARFATAAPPDAYGKAVAQQRSNYGIGGAFMAKEKILIVDDDMTLRAALSRYLQNRGYAVSDARSGAEALNLIEQSPPDIVVSDVMMPEMDGLEFCRRLRAMRGRLGGCIRPRGRSGGAPSTARNANFSIV